MLLAERLQSHEAAFENEGLRRAHQAGLARLIGMTLTRSRRERPISCQVRITGAGLPPTAPNARHLCIRTARPDGARPAPA
jgi:hypothetical protein